MTSKACPNSRGADTDRPGPSRTTPIRGGERAVIITMLFDLIAPVGMFYGLRAAGVGTYLALLASAAPPGLTAVAGLVRHRRLDRLGVVVMTMMLLSTGVSLITGSPQFLLAKEGWITGLWGAWFLISLTGKRPLAFRFSRQLLEGRRIPGARARASENRAAASWDGLWDSVPRFRRIWRVCTVIWGCALLVDAAIRAAMAYTLPISLVPALSGALWPVTFIGLQVITNVYFYRAGLWSILRRHSTVADGAFTHTIRGKTPTP
jgi:hypothetical protein